jgi:hypothetical protein
MLTDQVIRAGSLRAEPDGYRFDIRIPWYRSLPLSCFEELHCALDGQPVEEGTVTVEINGERRAMTQLPPLHDEWWYVGDAAHVHVVADALARGPHELDVTVAFRIPYLVEDGSALVMRERCVKREGA